MSVFSRVVRFANGSEEEARASRKMERFDLDILAHGFSFLGKRQCRGGMLVAFWRACVVGRVSC